MSLRENLNQATHFIRSKFTEKHIFPQIAIVLGSGLDSFAEALNPIFEIPYGEVPGFPVTSIAGHPGTLVAGYLNGHPILVLKGRIHIYEGYSADEAAFSSYLLAQLEIPNLIVTNAVGGMREELYLGALVLIEDHLNFTFNNPLIGVKENSQAFVDMSHAYKPQWRQQVTQVAHEQGIRLHSGIYGGISGPSYLSVAELKMLRRLGADVVGMSTIPEVIAAHSLKLNVLGISCVADMVVPEAIEPLDHEMVVRVAKQTKAKFTQLITAIVEQIFTSEVTL